MTIIVLLTVAISDIQMCIARKRSFFSLTKLMLWATSFSVSGEYRSKKNAKIFNGEVLCATALDVQSFNHFVEFK